jgi:hypothetical protein
MSPLRATWADRTARRENTVACGTGGEDRRAGSAERPGDTDRHRLAAHRSNRCFVARVSGPTSGRSPGLRGRLHDPPSHAVAQWQKGSRYSLTVAGAAPELHSAFWMPSTHRTSRFTHAPKERRHLTGGRLSRGVVLRQGEGAPEEEGARDGRASRAGLGRRSGAVARDAYFVFTCLKFFGTTKVESRTGSTRKDFTSVVNDRIGLPSISCAVRLDSFLMK